MKSFLNCGAVSWFIVLAHLSMLSILNFPAVSTFQPSNRLRHFNVSNVRVYIVCVFYLSWIPFVKCGTCLNTWKPHVSHVRDVQHPKYGFNTWNILSMSHIGSLKYFKHSGPSKHIQTFIKNQNFVYFDILHIRTKPDSNAPDSECLTF